jgi:hypothetical protein
LGKLELPGERGENPFFCLWSKLPMQGKFSIPFLRLLLNF